MSGKWKNKLLLMLLFVAVKCNAQPRYEAPLNAVPADGFYKIALTPEVEGRRYGVEDLRILDEQNAQVPYVSNGFSLSTRREIAFPIVEEGIGPDKQYYIIIENGTQAAFDRLYLTTRNSAATRALTVSGSEDKKHWYAVREDFAWAVQFWEDNKKLNGNGVISLPTTNYKYLRITFIGKGSLPIKVLKITNAGEVIYKNTFIEVPAPTILQKDSIDKNTYVTLLFDCAYQVDKLELNISGPKYFHRFAKIKTNGYKEMGDYLGSEISSGIQPVYLRMKGTEIRMIINNEDNPPLKVQAARAFQTQRGIIAYLETNRSYKLTFGDSLARFPVYDLDFFKDSIDKEIPELGIGATTAVSGPSLHIGPQSPFKHWMIWPVLAVLLGGLLYVTLKMVKQINKEEA